MHAEVVKSGGTPSQAGLIRDRSRAITCAECDASYYLYYDHEAEMRFTLCSVLAAEVICARHPDHERIIILAIPQRVEESPEKKVPW